MSAWRFQLAGYLASLISTVLSFIHLLEKYLTSLTPSTAQRYCPDGKVPLTNPAETNIWELMEKNGDNTDSAHWAPDGEEQNGWIQVGRLGGQTCKTYKQLFHKDPSWGMSDISTFEVTGYVMCCLEPSRVNDSLLPVEAASTMPKDTEGAIGQVDDVIDHIFDPILYDRNRGWEGSTYDEAIQFCAEREPARVICPFEV